MVKLALAVLLWQASPPSVGELEIQKYQEVDQLFVKSLNHARLISADQEAEQTARRLIEKYPDDPYVYNLWASTEWLLIGRELNLRADEQKDIGEVNNYRQRAEYYQALTEKALALTENKNDEKSLLLRAALKFDQAKFASRYQGRVAGLTKADQKAVEGIQILKQLLAVNPNFCSAYLFLGGTRLQLSVNSNESWTKWAGIRLFSSAYGELRSFDEDVLSETKSIEWLEKAYQCGYAQPWLKKTWLESGFLLVSAYRSRAQRSSNSDIREEAVFLQKEIPLLKQMVSIFPQNQDLTGILSQREFRLKILENYFKKK